jgi:hypothetical protein
MTIVKDNVFVSKQHQQETLVPLSHPQCHAQADFGDALAIIGDPSEMRASPAGQWLNGRSTFW